MTDVRAPSTSGALSTLARELKDILETLRARKIKSRKEALARLEVVLSNEANIAYVCALTFGVAPQDDACLGYATEYVSWTAILAVLMECVEEDVVRLLGKGSVPDSICSRVVRTVVNKAISQRDRKFFSMLGPVALRLMSHLSFVLERTFAFRKSSQVYNDYSTTLKFLIENDKYMGIDTSCTFSMCCLDAGDFANTLRPLCKMILQNVEGSREDNAMASFMVKDLSVLRAALGRMKYDLEPETKEMLMGILQSFGQNRNLREWTSRICNEVVGLCVQTMLYCCGDAMHELSDIAERFQHSVMLLVREGNPEGREAALVYLRVALRLELLDLGRLKEVVDWYQGIDLEGVWLKSPECADYVFNHEQSLLALLLADVEASTYQRLSRGVSADFDVGDKFDRNVGGNTTHKMKFKRRRQNRRLGLDLISDAVGQPAALGPVACIFLLKNAQCLSTDDFERSCNVLVGEVKSLLQHSFVSEQVKPDVVWILRMLYATVIAESTRAPMDTDVHAGVQHALGSAISFLIQRYKVLSSYPTTRDVVKMIIIAALPRLHDSISVGNSTHMDAESFRQEIFSESPSCVSVVLMTLLLLHRKFSSLSKPVVCLYIDWMTKAATSNNSITTPVPSDIVCSALCTLLFGGDTIDMCQVEAHIDLLKEQFRWWRETDIDLSVKNLPPISSSRLFSVLKYEAETISINRFTGSSGSGHAVVAADGTVRYLRDTLENILDSCVLEEDILNASALCLDLMSRVNKGASHSAEINPDVDVVELDEDGRKLRFGSLDNIVSRCISWIRSCAGSCSVLCESNVATVVRFADGLSKLSQRDKALVRGEVAQLPSLEDALNFSLSAMDCNDNELMERLSQPQARAGPITAGVRNHGDADRPIPMLQWYLRVLERTSCFDPSIALDNLISSNAYFSKTGYFLPVEVRIEMATLESSSILAMLEGGDVPPRVGKIHFLDPKSGLFSYDHDFIFRSGIFEEILHRGLLMVRRASALRDNETAKVCSSCIADQMFRLIRKSIDVASASSVRIKVADVIVSLMEIDSSLVPDELFEPLVDWLATLVVDRYSVRAAIASILPRLLDFFSDPKVLFQRVLEMLPLQSNVEEDKIIPIDCDLDELLRTVLLTLGTVASKIPDLELICVSCLIQEFQYEGAASETDSLEGVAMNQAIMDALGYIAESLGYDSTRSYLGVMSRSLIVHIMQDPKRAVFCMEKYLLTCRLVGANGVPGKEMLLAFLVYHRSLTGVKSLMAYFKVKHLPLILRRSMGEVCATHFFASTADHESVDSLLSGVVNNLTSMASLLRADLDIESLMGDLSDEVIINIIGRGSREFDTQQGDEESKVFSKDVRAVTALAERLNIDGHMAGSASRPVDSMMLLVSVQRKISDFRHPRHKVQAVRAATCAILYVEPFLEHPGILRQVLAIVSILMRYSTTREPACEILVHVIDHVVLHLEKAANYENLLQTIGTLLPTIMSYMCDSYNSSSGSDHHVVRCIRYLMLNRAAPYVLLRKHTTVLDPRIDTMLGDRGSLGTVTPVKDYLNAFGELVGLLSPSTRLEYITLIRRKMKECLRNTPRTTNFIAEKALWKIVLAASQNQDDKCLIDFAGELVSYFGPLKPNVLSFNPSKHSALPEGKETPGRISRAAAVDILECDTYRSAIILLYDYLVEDDSNAAAEAFQILQVILSTTSGVTALNTLEEIVREQLNLFLHCKLVESDNEEDLEFPQGLDIRLWKLGPGPVLRTGTEANSLYDEWVTRIGHDVLSKSTNPVLASCARLAKIKANFSEVLLPLAFVHLSLDKRASAKLGSVLGEVMTEHVLPHFGEFPKAANVLLRVLHSLRRLYNVDKEAAESGQFSPSSRLPWKTMYWVSIDYLALGEACVASRSLYSGIIFGEMWKEAMYHNAEKDEIQRYERLMQELNALLPEPDGLYAESRSNDAMSQLRRFEREGDWARAMVICDLALQLQEENPSAPVLNISRQHALSCMRRCLGNLGSTYLLSFTRRADLDGQHDGSMGSLSRAVLAPMPTHASGPISCVGMSHEVASPGAVDLGEWYPMQASDDLAGSQTADSQLASAMKHFRIGYSEGFSESLHAVRDEVISLLASASRETTADLNPLIVKAQMAECIAEAWHVKWRVGPEERDAEVDATVESWKRREDVAGAGWRFSLEMPMKDLRNELLRIIGRDDLKARCLLDIAVCARKAERNGQALGALSRLRRSLQTTANASSGNAPGWSREYRVPEANWFIEEAKNLWAQNQKDAAIMTLLSKSRESARRTVNSDNVVSVAYLKCLLAKWLASTQRESSQTILHTLIETADALADIDWAATDPTASNKACRIFYRMASYANQLRTEIAQRKLSVEWVKAKSILEKNRRQMEDMESKLESAKKQAKSKQLLLYSMNKLNRTIKEDAHAIDLAEVNELEYETLAIRFYCMALRHGGRYDLPATFRLVDRWLSPQSPDQGNHINLVFRNEAKDVPSHKLIPLGYQLASRLDDTKKDADTLFQSNLKSTIFRMSKEHPFHMLPILFALKNGAKTKEVSESRGGLAFQANESRINAATELICRVKRVNKRLHTIVDELDCATQGYIEIAMSDVEPSAKSAPFPAKWRRKFCKELNDIPILSILLPFDLSLAYEDLPTLVSIDERMMFPGGINKPKLVTVTDSRGQIRRQLVKGKDDLRQDAVMQQFFRICNAFFQDAKATASRNLSIGTYFALPFSPSSGLLEWIDNTESLEEFITDGNKKYHRATRDVMVKLHDIQTKKRGWNETVPLKEKVKLFEQCVNELGAPRMGRVFLRRFSDPGRWFEARLAYTRSVAVNSMAGHIIGLGDRHLSNILLSKATADVIHIDLGIAFEQGKLLRTPEQVPFRLTRNMVDAMGAAGVEGVMRRCCEEVLRVMRKHKEPIVTVLSVFIHDPLYTWSLSHDRIAVVKDKTSQEENTRNDDAARHHGNDDDGNVDANRTLLVIKNKLEGIIGGDTTTRGVEGQVQHLLQESMEVENLCRMWRGWQPHI